VLQAVPEAGAADDASDPEIAETARLAQGLPADETQLLYSLCLHGRADLGLAPDEYAALTMVLLRLLAFKPAAALDARQAATQEKKSLNSPPPASPPGKRVPVRDSAPAEAAVARAGAQNPVDAVRQEMDLERDKQGQQTDASWQGEDATEPVPAGDAHLFDEALQAQYPQTASASEAATDTNKTATTNAASAWVWAAGAIVLALAAWWLTR
jgi:DNA polymerase-3 subunit gamma/tau